MDRRNKFIERFNTNELLYYHISDSKLLKCHNYFHQSIRTKKFIKPNCILMKFKCNHEIIKEAQFKMPNRIFNLSSTTIFNSTTIFSYFIIILLLIFNFNLAQSTLTIINEIKTKEYNLGDLSQNNYQFIEPKVVINNKDNKNYDSSINAEIISIPLSSNISCPNILRIYFSGFNDKFVIDLIKNKRLISDRYFQISKDNINRHNRHPDSSSRQLSLGNKDIDNDHDHEFYKNHMFLNLHNFTSNDDHCHYHGYVNDNLSSISAISIVNNRLLSGFFHDGNEIYYLHANTNNYTTILTKSSNLFNNNSNFLQNTLESLDINSYLQLIDNNKTKLEEHKKKINQLNDDDNEKLTSKIKYRSRRAIKNRRSSTNSDNYIKHDPFQSNSSSLYVELLIVHDHSQYIDYKKNTSNIAERTMQIVNIMNAFYRQLNIFVALVGVVLWTEKDEIQLTDDGDSTLTNFLKYRYEKLLPKYHHDNAQLITSTSFNGSVVGKALKGPICTHEHSGGVNTDHSHSPAIVAVTLAHELGHNLGMEHDEDDKCKCPDEKCIMSSSSSTVHPKHWSSCSIDYLEDSRKHGLLDCLIERPTKIFGPMCGNGFVEEGEDCDLGEPLPTYGTSKSKKSQSTAVKCTNGIDCNRQNSYNQLSINPCCDRQTCKFIGNATCAQGPCCDLNSCSIYNGTETKVCRQRKTECDFEEICDGKSEYCPPDIYYHDGIECGSKINSEHYVESISYINNFNRSRAYCYEGKCASHETQCQLLWGSSGSASRDICYDQNVHGNTSGNCGYNRKEKLYNTCESEDAICGMLHCVHDQQTINGITPANNNGDLTTLRKTGKLNYGFESASILTVSFFVMSNHNKIYCNGAIIDAGPNVRDPGLVPNGAFCGDEKMCLNQKCVPIYDIVYKNWCPSDCNGNGICDNMGVCHCNDGTIGTSCYQFFGANFHLSLLLYIIMFFIPMIALIILTINHYKRQIKIWWFLHNRKIELKNKARDPNHQLQKRIGSYINDIDRNKLSISDPIPLNEKNVNRLFQAEPNSNLTQDPWAETVNINLSVNRQ